MSEMNRREALTLIALAPFATAGAGARPASAQPPATAAAKRGAEPKFFTPHEFATVVVLADLVLPADERSPSASEAGVPEFIDFILSDFAGTPHRAPIRGGLAWLDAESRRRFGKSFVDAAEPERTAILDDIAWPARARPEMSHGVAFFNRFRDMVASGFWSSEVGVQDLGYQGNRAVAQWEGCPPEALRRLGVSYDT
jgi:gluconate 2-dehydrogenase gamma chain